MQIYANLPKTLSTNSVNFLIENVDSPGNILPNSTATGSDGEYNACKSFCVCISFLIKNILCIFYLSIQTVIKNKPTAKTVNEIPDSVVTNLNGSFVSGEY